MLYTVPAAPAHAHASSSRFHMTDDSHLLLNRTESHSSAWSFPETHISRKLIRGLKRIATRGSLKREAAGPASPIVDKFSLEDDDDDEIVHGLTKSESECGGSLASTATSTSSSSSTTGPKHGSAPGPAKSEKQAGKRRRMLKNVGHSIVICMGSMYGIPPGMPVGRNFTAHATPAPIFW